LGHGSGSLGSPPIRLLQRLRIIIARARDGEGEFVRRDLEVDRGMRHCHSGRVGGGGGGGVHFSDGWGLPLAFHGLALGGSFSFVVVVYHA
jgi:hypothetical protein